MHSHWIPIENKIKVNMLAIPEKPLKFQISKSDVIAPKKDTFQETFPLSPAFLLQF
jgi:hypothetical protein